ncbi:MAG TPA: hypothetical protein VHV30_04260 [Polyangiaceae bacterium]|jgi:hypothetical protein|nr:hypothetical protein [Polyangiaceae bacterium]
MRLPISRVRLVLFGIPLVVGTAAGCLGQAERMYYDDLTEGGTDGTTVPQEASPGNDASGDDGGDGGMIVPTDDGGGGDGEPTREPDAADTGAIGDDAGEALDAGPDAPFVEAGCGPTTTTDNCGACGAACDKAHSTPSACASGACAYSACTPGWGDCDAGAGNFDGCETRLNVPTNCLACGATCEAQHSSGAACGASGCTYQGCATGWSMCNTAAPNYGGCACNTPSCCGTSCQTAHSNGLGNSFYDCARLGTVDASTQAFEACSASKDASAQCSGGWTCSGSTTQFVCDAPSTSAKGACARCWAYAGPQTGTVQDCSCPGVVIGNWN